ncbi:MAG: hypothetical protein ACE366_18760 [Bradymonadia bacterium]
MKASKTLICSGALMTSLCLAGCGEGTPGIWGGPMSQDAPPIPAAPGAYSSGQTDGSPSGGAAPQNAGGLISGDWVPVTPQAQGSPFVQGSDDRIDPAALTPVEYAGYDWEVTELGDKPAAPGDAPSLAHGDVCTFDLNALAHGCETGREVACVVGDKFDAMFPDGLKFEGADGSFELTSAGAMMAALPPEGSFGPADGHVSDPDAKSANPLAMQLAMVYVNLEMSAQGIAGRTPLQSVRRTHGPFEGWTYSAIAETASQAITGDDDVLDALGIDFDKLGEELAILNVAAQGCAPSDMIER